MRNHLLSCQLAKGVRLIAERISELLWRGNSFCFGWKRVEGVQLKVESLELRVKSLGLRVGADALGGRHFHVSLIDLCDHFGCETHEGDALG